MGAAIQVPFSPPPRAQQPPQRRAPGSVTCSVCRGSVQGDAVRSRAAGSDPSTAPLLAPEQATGPSTMLPYS